MVYLIDFFVEFFQKNFCGCENSGLLKLFHTNACIRQKKKSQKLHRFKPDYYLNLTKMYAAQHLFVFSLRTVHKNAGIIS